MSFGFLLRARAQWHAAEAGAQECLRRHLAERRRDGSVERVEGDVKLDEVWKVEIGDLAGETVFLEVERPEACEVIERRRDTASEVVAGEVET